MRAIQVFVCMLLLAGCARDFKVMPVAYNKPATVTSSKTATVELLTGVVGGSREPGSLPVVIGSNVMSVPVSSGPYSELHFGREDQEIFISSLRNELNRLGILKVIDSGSGDDADFRIRILFSQTHHIPFWQEYTLDVAVEMKGRNGTFESSYHVLSSEGDSTWENHTTNAVQGKTKAAQKLINLLIRDIESWLASER